MIELIPSSGAVIDAANPVNWSHPSMQPGVRPVAWYLALPGLMGGGKWRDLMSPADLRTGNHGTLTNIAQSGSSGWQPTSRPGGFGSLLLDGVNDYVLCPSITAIKTSTGLTVTAWAKYLGINTELVGIYSNTQTMFEFWNDGSGFFNYYIYGDVSGATYSSRKAVAATNTGMWVHLVGVFDGPSGRIDVYVNGSLSNGSLAGTGVPSATTATSEPLRIGAFSGGASPSGFLNGSVDDVQIYPRPLSGIEIRNRYLASLAGYPGELNRINTIIAPPTGSGLLLQRRRAA